MMWKGGVGREQERKDWFRGCIGRAWKVIGDKECPRQVERGNEGAAANGEGGLSKREGMLSVRDRKE